MKKRTSFTIASAAITLGSMGLLACGGGSDDGNVTPDGSVVVEPDAEIVVSCTDVTTGEQAAGQNEGSFNFAINEDLGTAMPAYGQLEVYSDFGKDSFIGTFDLTSAGQDDNYSTCATCFRAFAVNAAGDAFEKQWFQSGGSVTFTADPLTGKLEGTVTDLSMVEVTIDMDTFTSTPVDGGSCLSLGSFTLDVSNVPAEWTCDETAYGDGANCDCACGAVDPDCAIEDAPVTGCDAGEVCGAGVCGLPAANDTCGTATALVLGLATTGSNFGAANDINAGLEGDACTGFPQPGGDVAFSIALLANQGITVTLNNYGSETFDPSIAILGPGTETVCTAETVTCLAGADAGIGGEPETFNFTAPTAGNYYIIVDSYSAAQVSTFAVTAAILTP